MPRKDALDRMIEVALAKWKQNVGPTPAAIQGFQAIRALLMKSARGLKAARQEFPPKYALSLPARKRGEHVWEFASVAAVENDVYFELFPLGLDVVLRNHVSPELRKREYRPDDGYRLPGGGRPYLDEIAGLIVLADEWFRREIIPDRPLPPCQQLDQYLIEPSEDETPAMHFESLGPKARPLQQRLVRAFGRGAWKLAVATTRVTLPGWSKSCVVELHRYDRGPKAEGPKIKHFVKGGPTEQPCAVEVVYAADSDFRASLEGGRRYHCTALRGRNFQGYIRVIDESGEAYWYPERFFITGE